MDGIQDPYWEPLLDSGIVEDALHAPTTPPPSKMVSPVRRLEFPSPTPSPKKSLPEKKIPKKRPAASPSLSSITTPSSSTKKSRKKLSKESPKKKKEVPTSFPSFPNYVYHFMNIPVPLTRNAIYLETPWRLPFASRRRSSGTTRLL